MNAYNFHINLYDLAFLGTIFIGLSFALQLWFTKRVNRAANRFLALALGAMVLWMVWILGIDAKLGSIFPRWNWLPLQFSLALGPLIFFYVRKITWPAQKFCWKDLLHFGPVLLQQSVLVLAISQSVRTDSATYDTLIFKQLNPVLYLWTAISVITYLYLSHRLIERFYRRMKFNELRDRYRHELRWLHRLLIVFGLLWFLWISLLAVDQFYYHQQLGIHAYYPLYLLLAVMMIRIAAEALSRAEITAPAPLQPVSKLPPPAALKQKGAWLKKAVEVNRFYLDPELNLNSLAEKLGLSVHELSRIINTALKKSFHDFINEYRARDVARKMRDPAYDHLTLLGIAYDSGFNSKTSFHRIFRQMTGKSPAEYKTELRKEGPSYKLEPHSRIAPLVLSHETMLKWSHDTSNRNFMFKNDLKTGWRMIMRNKAYSFINVIGLALGICTCIVIFLITDYEFSFDKFHHDGDRIYRIVGEAQAPSGEKEFLNSLVPDVAGFQYAIPGFEAKAALHFINPKVSIRNSNQRVTVFKGDNEIIITEPQYFDIFKYKWLAGNPASALSKPNQIVLSEKRAHIYFGNTPLYKMIGRTMVCADSLQLTVSGIVKNWDKNTDFGYSAFMSICGIQNGFLRKFIPTDDWKGLWPHQTMVFVKLYKEVTAAQVNAHFAAFIKKNVKLSPGAKLTMELQPLTDIHFSTDFLRGDDGDNFRKAYLPILYTLIGIAVFILIIAVVNFINLSTAQSIKRAKEIGVRKVMGSSRMALVLQFLTETFLLTLFAVVTAVIFVGPVLALFHSFIPEGVKFDLFNTSTIFFLISVTVVTCLLAGFYPARVLSSYLPVLSLKGAAVQKGTGQLSLRKTLIVFQFAISLIFIIGAIVIGSQVRYMNNADKGFKMDDIITMNNFGDTSNKLNILAQRIKQIAGVQKVILQGNSPMGFAHNDASYLYKGKNERRLQVSLEIGDEDFIPFYQMKLVAGRNIGHSDSLKELVINETYAKALGFANPADAVGVLLYNGANKPFPVVGIVADFHEHSFHQRIQPVVIEHVPGMEQSVAVKLNSKGKQLSDVKNAISQIGAEWKKIYPDIPFDYSVLEESVKLLYGQEQNTATLINAAMFITIFISCMGLFGLIMFTAQLKTKEIGIRKVLGASVANIAAMLSREFIGLVVMSILIASPIAWYFMNQWLQDFVYRIHFSVWIFVAAGVSAVLIALLTVSFQAVKAALVNPVKSLRSE
ncbi:MAG: ABC transporter permease [Bacteroidetes bacterium]|nr:ABC transporter permease [Bacteroidota bacterium]